MLHDWERKTPGRTENVFRALTAIAPSQLADRTLFDFAGLVSRSDVRPDPAQWLLGGAAAEAGDGTDD